MRTLKHLAHIVMVWLVIALTGWGQGQTPTQPQTQQSVPWYNPQAQANARHAEASSAAEKRQADNAYARMQENMMRVRMANSRKGVALPVVLTEEELTPNERKALAPAPEDLKAHAEFLRQPDTGIFRLLRMKPDYGRVANVNDPLTSVPVYLAGGGSHYSFKKLNHNADKWSDICIFNNAFVAGIAGDSHGLLVELGEVELTQVNTDSSGVDYLTRFAPAHDTAGAEKIFSRLDQGIKENGFSYSLSSPMKLDTTYALRSINYGRSDLLVTFRAVRQDKNDSLIILWKKLKSYPTPKLKK